LGTRKGVFVGTSDEELRQKIAPPPRVFVVGHTHQPLIRQLDKTLVVNAGSVGLPFDGDPRAGYAQLTWHSETGAWQAEIVRLAYDRERADRDFDETGFITQGGPFAVIIRDELRRSTSHLYEWTRRYESAVMSGELTLEESVQRYLADVGLT
jgi:diadenosine tetraphosphatase ApaH/serine/threonine PP2A family protein phosphatase